jgi:hypothetical protein
MAKLVSLGVIFARELGGTIRADESLLRNERHHDRALWRH